jgi:hypothetical protein
MNKLFSYLGLCLTLTALMCACGSGTSKKGRHLVIGDSSKIVTERDSQYLVNVVRDLAEVHGTQSKNAIDEVMRDVDSTQKSISLNKPTDTKALAGTILNSKSCDLVIAGAVVKSGNRYIFQTGSVEENMTCLIKNLDSCKLEQRSCCVLTAVLDGKATELTSLGTHTTEWQKLPGKNCTYISHSKVDMKYKEISAGQLASLVKPLISKSGLPKVQQQKLNDQLKTASSTNSDLYQAKAQWIELRASGILNGKAIVQVFKIEI